MCECEKSNLRTEELRVTGSRGAFNTTGGRAEFDTRPVLYGPDGKVIEKEKPVFGFGS